MNAKWDKNPRNLWMIRRSCPPLRKSILIWSEQCARWISHFTQRPGLVVLHISPRGIKKKGITKVPSKLKWFMYINLLLVQDYICWLEYSRSVLQGNLSTIHEGFHYVYKNVLCTHFRVYKHIYRTLTEKRSLPRRYSMKFNETHALLFSSCLRTKIYMNIYIYFK